MTDTTTEPAQGDSRPPDDIKPVTLEQSVEDIEGRR